ncbi:MAG: hypothetical protein CMK76_07305 [Pseudomonadales bacterium]|nr:hypothetical protein [Pseudomonadales bacterium]
MARVFDVAEFILQSCGPMSAMKLQKLVYYSLAWHLVWHERLMFGEPVEAWANGPVVRDLYHRHQGNFLVEPGFFGGVWDLNGAEVDSIQKVLSFYGNKDPQWLSNLTHMEDPWRHARVGIPDGERCDRVISAESMLEYYSSL